MAIILLLAKKTQIKSWTEHINLENFFKIACSYEEKITILVLILELMYHF